MLHSSTLASLSLDDLQQRYLSSLIDYDHKIYYVDSISGDPHSGGWPFTLHVHIPKAEPPDAAPEKKEIGLEFAEPRVGRMRVIMKAYPAAKDLQKIKFNPDLVNLERPVPAWYQKKTDWCYLFYSASKQFCRGFNLGRNTHLNPALGQERLGYVDLAEILEGAISKPLAPKQHFRLAVLQEVLKDRGVVALSPYMLAVQKKKSFMGHLFYRNHLLGELNGKQIVLENPVFLDEVKEVLSGCPVVSPHGMKYADI